MILNPEWKSPRKVEEEIKVYQHNRFEAYMQMVDKGELPRAIGISAMYDDIESGIWKPIGKEITDGNY